MESAPPRKATFSALEGAVPFQGPNWPIWEESPSIKSGAPSAVEGESGANSTCCFLHFEELEGEHYEESGTEGSLPRGSLVQKVKRSCSCICTGVQDHPVSIPLVSLWFLRSTIWSGQNTYKHTVDGQNPPTLGGHPCELVQKGFGPPLNHGSSGEAKAI